MAELKQRVEGMTIFNMSNRDKGELSLFVDDTWLELSGGHAAYFYTMHDRLENLKEQNEKLVEAAKLLCKKHGEIAFAVGSGRNPREADWLSADDALSELRAEIKKAEIDSSTQEG